MWGVRWIQRIPHFRLSHKLMPLYLLPPMPISKLTVADLRLTVDPESLGFADTSELLEHALSWIGQDRAEIATHFGLGMDQADYNLFVLGEVGSGRSSLLKQAMQTAASKRAIPPDLCYLYNFDAPEHPRALRLPAGQGRLLRQCMARMMKVLLDGNTATTGRPPLQGRKRAYNENLQGGRVQGLRRTRCLWRGPQFHDAPRIRPTALHPARQGGACNDRR